MFCSKCGNTMPDGTRFCPYCGAEQPLPSVGFGEAIRRFFQNYANFSGRARRSEYWWAILFTNLVSGVLSYAFSNSDGLSILSSLWSLAVLIPGLAIVVRRLHDVGKSGWFYLWIFLPIIGWIIILIQLCKDSRPGANEYGPNPKFCW